MEQLASDLSAGERATLIRLLKKIGYKAAAALSQEARGRRLNGNGPQDINEPIGTLI